MPQVLKNQQKANFVQSQSERALNQGFKIKLNICCTYLVLVLFVPRLTEQFYDAGNRQLI